MKGKFQFLQFFTISQGQNCFILYNWNIFDRIEIFETQTKPETLGKSVLRQFLFVHFLFDTI
jgi:hypothetical protein